MQLGLLWNEFSKILFATYLIGRESMLQIHLSDNRSTESIYVSAIFSFEWALVLLLLYQISSVFRSGFAEIAYRSNGTIWLTNAIETTSQRLIFVISYMKINFNTQADTLSLLTSPGHMTAPFDGENTHVSSRQHNTKGTSASLARFRCVRLHLLHIWKA